MRCEAADEKKVLDDSTKSVPAANIADVTI